MNIYFYDFFFAANELSIPPILSLTFLSTMASINFFPVQPPSIAVSIERTNQITFRRFLSLLVFPLKMKRRILSCMPAGERWEGGRC